MVYPNVDLITVNFNGRPYLKDFFSHLNAQSYPCDKLRVFFVDNHSKDQSLIYAKGITLKYPLRIIANDTNYGFARANNRIIRSSSAEFIALLNNDTKIDPGWLEELARKITSSEEIGMVCSREVPSEPPRFIDKKTLEVSWCSGGHCLIRKSALERVGLFDERFFLYGEDVDLSWRMWLGGFKCFYVPEAVCHHHYGALELHILSRKYFFVRNSLLIRFAYGTLPKMKSVYYRWIKEALFLALKKRDFLAGCAVFFALIGSLRHIPYFLNKGKRLKENPSFPGVQRVWIQV